MFDSMMQELVMDQELLLEMIDMGLKSSKAKIF